MKPKYIIPFLIFFYCTSLNAQNCWTVPSQLDALAGINYGIVGTPGPYTVRIYAHVIRLGAHSGGATVQEIYSAIDIISGKLAPHNICVSLRQIDYIDDDPLYNTWSPFTTPAILESTIFNTDGINIYFLPSTNPISGGMAHHTGGSRSMSIGGVFFGQVGYLSPAIAHEFGHCLGLEHTHLGTHFCSLGFGCEKNVARVGVNANWNVCGDYVGDTPADPCLDWGTNMNHVTCIYVPIVYDTHSELYVPDGENLMAYTYVLCMNHFTPGQGERMRNFLAGAGLQAVLIPDDVYLQNITFSALPPFPSTEILYAGPSGITAGENVTTGTTGNVVINSLARIEFRGKNYVDLEPGFFANNTSAGTRFEAVVDPNFCSTISEINTARIGNQSSSLYHPILANSSWLSSLAGIEGYINSLYTTIGDTSINGTGYKKVFKRYVYLPGINNDSSINGQDIIFLREDNSQKILLQYYPWVGEKEIFNFSLQIGDTLTSQIVFGYTLTTIDSILTNQGYRNRFIFTDSSSHPIIWVEGVGNLSQPFLRDYYYDTTVAQLLCVHQNGSLVYEYPYFVPITCGIYNFIETSSKENPLMVFPNPNNGHFNILCDYGKDISKSIWICDALGNLITSEVSILSKELQLDLSSFPKGVYFIKVVSDNQTSIQKIILM